MNANPSTPIPFERLFAALPGLLLATDKTFNILAVNDWVLKTHDKRRDELVGKPLTLLFPEATTALHGLLATQHEQRISFRAASGGLTRMVFTPIDDEHNHFQYVLVNIDHVASEHASPGATSDSGDLKDLFATVFEFNPAALALSRISDSTVVNVNASFLRLFEFATKADVVGKTSAELNMMSAAEHRNEIIRLLSEKLNVLSVEGNIRTSRGNQKWISCSIIRVEVNGEACLLSAILDITGRKETEEQQKKVNTELEQLVAQRTKDMMQAELDYASIVEQATDGVFISDLKGKYLDANPSACQMVGYTKEEILSLTMHDLLMPADVARNPPKFSELMAGKNILSTRVLRRKDGSPVHVEINAKMLANGRMLGLVRDITERRKVEEQIQNLNIRLEEKVVERTAALEKKIVELHESEEKFQKAFHASSAGITITRLSDARYMEVNDAFLEMIGYTRGEVLQHSSAELGLIVNFEGREKLIRELTELGSVKQMEMTVRKKSGELLEVLSSIETIFHNGERFAINIIYDITERKRGEEKLAAVNRELEAFSYSVSHDLRAPLRSIIGYSELIREDFASSIAPGMEKHLQRIQSNATRMGRLIDDLLEFSRLGKLEIQKTNVDTFLIVEKSIADLKNNTPEKTAIAVRELLPAVGDRAMLSQVWLNLLSNAIKYSSKKEAPAVEVGSYATENEVVFYVKDNGAGFNMEFAAKLFGVFQRLHRPSDFEGTGVGLALVKRIIDKHGGRVWAEGEEEQGATFYFSLPKAQDA
ncbi:PAS domain S-box protein [Chryseolinea lacunae]|uniref:histidine kinase n=1 Tax=Chryseolinea lacunae TaxID=2801331 RepID=A0ABS1KN98_9BACT|nr:PAS domain S-box protein [Chryseolinea lacunae]MBL0740813.1 PAS domain S-box protein [Chryseolinea lacunae]